MQQQYRVFCASGGESQTQTKGEEERKRKKESESKPGVMGRRRFETEGLLFRLRNSAKNDTRHTTTTTTTKNRHDTKTHTQLPSNPSNEIRNGGTFALPPLPSFSFTYTTIQQIHHYHHHHHIIIINQSEYHGRTKQKKRNTLRGEARRAHPAATCRCQLPSNI
jgi:hypothetical protein